jgi:hypothetical protein
MHLPIQPWGQISYAAVNIRNFSSQVDYCNMTDEGKRMIRRTYPKNSDTHCDRNDKESTLTF